MLPFFDTKIYFIITTWRTIDIWDNFQYIYVRIDWFCVMQTYIYIPRRWFTCHTVKNTRGTNQSIRVFLVALRSRSKLYNGTHIKLWKKLSFFLRTFFYSTFLLLLLLLHVDFNSSWYASNYVFVYGCLYMHMKLKTLCMLFWYGVHAVVFVNVCIDVWMLCCVVILWALNMHIRMYACSSQSQVIFL